MSRTVPKRVKEDVSKSSFVREQQRKKEEIDRLRNLDMQSLKSLNSPIPSLSSKGPGVVPPTTYRAPPAVVAKPVPAPVRAQAQPIPSGSSPPPPAKPLSLFEMTKMKQDSPPSSSTARPVAKKEPPAKRVVRQRVIRDFDDDDDDDGDDDETMMRSGAPGLTVADALKKQRKNGGGGGAAGGKANQSAEDKAKQWGIDMSRFN